MQSDQRSATASSHERRARRPRDFPLTDHVDLIGSGIHETPRQREVLDAVAQGLENKEIARILGIGEQRVKVLVSVLLQKFGVPTRAALTHAAFDLNLLGVTTDLDIPYSYLFDESPVLIAVTEGADHRFVIVNSAYTQAFGDRQYAGRSFRECFGDAPEQMLAAMDRTYLEGVRYARSELRSVFSMPDDGDREFVLSVICEPIRSATNDIGGLIFFVMDMTAVAGGVGSLKHPWQVGPVPATAGDGGV